MRQAQPARRPGGRTRDGQVGQVRLSAREAHHHAVTLIQRRLPPGRQQRLVLRAGHAREASAQVQRSSVGWPPKRQKHIFLRASVRYCSLVLLGTSPVGRRQTSALAPHLVVEQQDAALHILLILLPPCLLERSILLSVQNALLPPQILESAQHTAARLPGSGFPGGAGTRQGPCPAGPCQQNS